MGLDAVVTIWVGSRSIDIWKNEFGSNEHIEKLREYESVTLNNIEIEAFCYESGDVFGVGVELVHHNWDSDPMKVDFDKLADEAYDLLPQIKAAFTEIGLPTDDLGVYLQANMF